MLVYKLKQIKSPTIFLNPDSYSQESVMKACLKNALLIELISIVVNFCNLTLLRKIYKSAMKKQPLAPGRRLYVFKYMIKLAVLLPHTTFTIAEILLQYQNGTGGAE